jgi:hypothetical protein
MFCILCKGEIEAGRARRGGVTCDEDCAKELNRLRRAMIAKLKCRLCGRRFRTRKPVERVSGTSKGLRAPTPTDLKLDPVRDPHKHVPRIV